MRLCLLIYPETKKMKTLIPASSGRTPPVLLLAAAFWLAGLVAVLAWIGIYSNTPSAPGHPPAWWPEHSKLTRVAGQPNLVMFVHPRCPCSRASLGELARLLVQDRGLGSVQVVFINPPGKTLDWAQTDLWQQATALGGVAVFLDQDGTEAKHFGVETSGQTLLYAATGELLFQGGITISRGHTGDSPGLAALENLLAHKISNLVKTPTFGCSLFAESCAKGEATCQP
jgi:hypothetical protein